MERQDFLPGLAVASSLQQYYYSDIPTKVRLESHTEII